jgi:hypothetical protein
MNAAPVRNVGQSPKAIHKVADTGSCGSDHVGEAPLSDPWNEGLGLVRLSAFSHEEQYPGKTLLAVVEELIDKIFLCSNSSEEHEFQEEIRKLMLLMQESSHLVAVQVQERAW